MNRHNLFKGEFITWLAPACHEYKGKGVVLWNLIEAIYWFNPETHNGTPKLLNTKDMQESVTLLFISPGSQITYVDSLFSGPQSHIREVSSLNV